MSDSIKGGLQEIHQGEIESIYSTTFKKHAESIIWSNDSQQSFSTVVFGSPRINFNIPWRDTLMTWIVADFELPASGTIGPAAAYRIIRDVRFKMGSGQFLTLDGPQVMLAVLDQCDTPSKRAAVLQAAGGVADTRVITATEHVQAFIPLPFSKLRAMNKKKPYDLNTIGADLTVQISLRPASDVYTANPPAALVSGLIQWRQGVFLNAQDQIAIPQGKSYKYPFSLNESFQESYTGSTIQNQGKVTISDFTSAGLKMILIQNILTSDLALNNQLAYEPLEDLEIKVNNNVLWSSSYNMSRLTDLTHVTFPNEIFQPLGTSRRYHRILVSEFNPVDADGDSQASSRQFARKNMNLRFTNKSNNNYTMFLTYVYDSVIISNGVTAAVSV